MKRPVSVFLFFVLSISVFGQAPTITSFSPTSGKLGDQITIVGTNFDEVTTVTIGGGSPVTFTIDSPTKITATITDAGMNGEVLVTNSSGSAFRGVFNYITGPKITSFSPSSLRVGETLTIHGTGFGSSIVENIVRFGSLHAQIVSASTTSLQVIVPKGADGERVSVTTNNLMAIAPDVVNITFAGEAITNQSFSSPLHIWQPSGWNEVFVADLNSDGKADILSDLHSSIHVFISESIGNEVTVTSQSIGISGRLAEIEDWDGDGKMDLLIASSGYKIFKNTSANGNISFASPGVLITSYGFDVMTHDIDMDGRPDLISYNNDNIYVCRNISTPGEIRFAAAEEFEGGEYLYGVDIGDLDGDGKPEIVCAISSGTVKIFRNFSNPGDVSLTPFVLTPAIAPSGVVVADLDGNNRPEITVLHQNSSVFSIFWNGSDAGSLAFSPDEDFNTVTNNKFGDATDLNGDGKPELVFYNAGKGIIIYENLTANENLNFGTGIELGLAYVNQFRFADIDFNGRPDIIAGTESIYISILENEVNESVITTVSPMIAATGSEVTIRGKKLSTASGVLFGEIPAQSFTIISDEEISAVVGNGATGMISVTTNLGNAQKTGFIVNNGPTIVSFEPIEGSAGDTIVITGERFDPLPANNIVRLGTTLANIVSASGNELKVIVPPGAASSSITVRTGNGIASTSTNFLYTYNGPTQPNAFMFDSSTDFAVGNNSRGLGLGDFDDDGLTDLVVSSAGGNSVGVFRNASSIENINMQERVDFATGSVPEGIVVADLNRDGKLDIVTANSSDNTLSVLVNQSSSGEISFQSKMDFPTNVNPLVLAAADVNSDGYIDLIASHYRNAGDISILFNTSSGNSLSFAAPFTLDVASFPIGVGAADFNNDGKIDLAVSYDNDLTVYLNTSNGSLTSFASPVSYISGTSGLNAMLISDINQDKLSDIILTTSNSSAVIGLYNLSASPGTFENKSIRIAGFASTAGISAVADLDGDSSPDFLVPDANNNNKLINIQGFEIKSISSSAVSNVIMVNDFNGDGMSDFVSLHESSNMISITRNISAVIDSLSTTSASRGDHVLIYGKNIGNATEVVFGDVAASTFNVVSTSTIDAVVGEGSSGKVWVKQADVASSFDEFLYVPKPQITSFSPASADINETVTISGFDFIDVNEVYFGESVANSFQVVSVNTIIAITGDGSSGTIKVSTAHGDATIEGFVHLNDVVGVEKTASKECMVYPNPVIERDITFTVAPSWQSKRLKVSLKNIMGREVLSNQIISGPVNQIQAIGVQSGLYFIEISQANRTIVRKVIFE